MWRVFWTISSLALKEQDAESLAALPSGRSSWDGLRLSSGAGAVPWAAGLGPQCTLSHTCPGKKEGWGIQEARQHGVICTDHWEVPGVVSDLHHVDWCFLNSPWQGIA